MKDAWPNPPLTIRLGTLMSSEDTATASIFIRNSSIAILLLMPIAALGTRFGIWPFTIGLLLFAVSMLSSVLIQIITAIWLIRKPQKPGTKTALRWASVFALPPLVIVALTLSNMSKGYPPIHNISTDTANPPQFTQALTQRGSDSNPLDYSKELAHIQNAAYPDLTTVMSTKSASDTYKNALAICLENGWDVYGQNPEDGTIEAVDTSFWFGFKDDIIVRIEATDTGSKMDLRSVSRVGVSDIGVNANRIRHFVTSFEP
ncbi:MAG: hypothetical protein ACI92E_002209 [Oceanicoccus sp.]|jgi:hypothetical protein